MIIIFQLKVAILGYTPFSDITGGILCIVGIGRLIFGRLNWGFNIQNPTWKLDYRLDHPFSLDLSSIFCGKNQGNTLTIHQIRDIYIYILYICHEGFIPFSCFLHAPQRGLSNSFDVNPTWRWGFQPSKKSWKPKWACVYIYNHIYIYTYIQYIYIYVCIYTHIPGWWFGTFFIFPYIGNSNPNWLSYFSEGLKPPTRIRTWYIPKHYDHLSFLTQKIIWQVV